MPKRKTKMPTGMELIRVGELVPYARNARRHTPEQIQQIRASIREFGFLAPVLVDRDKNIIAGHGRVQAAQAEGLAEVPCVFVEHLTDAQRRAYIIADNRMSELGMWDRQAVICELQDLAEAGLDCAITGFQPDDLKIPDLGDGFAQNPGTAPQNRNAAGDSTSGNRDSVTGLQDKTTDLRDKATDLQDNARAPAPGGDGRMSAAELAAAFEDGMRNAENGEESEEYQAFLQKFENKKTTDDCYTPEGVYDAIRDWAVNYYHLEGRTIVRPFYPGGDYQAVHYAPDAVVLDNPPFSLLSEILDFYLAHDVKFFLFAPGLVVFNYLISRPELCAVVSGKAITYANGARVPTSFLTNLAPGIRLEIRPDLAQIVKSSSDAAAHAAGLVKSLPRYELPTAVLTAARAGYMANYGQALRVKSSECVCVRALDSQKNAGKSIYGSGLLLSTSATAEKAAAEKAAAITEDATFWPLSAREQKIIDGLG